MKNFKMTREFYLRSDYVLIKETPLLQVYRLPETLIAQAFTGKQSKPTWHLRFQTEERMMAKIEELEKSLIGWEKMKEERKQQRKTEKASVQVGDILYNSWGWEQTNIDFYQVVEVKGGQFTIQEIAASRVEGSMMSHGMADEVVPVKDQFISEDKIVKRGFNMECGFLSRTEVGKSHYRSWYA